MSRKLLLISKNPKDDAFSRTVAATAGLELVLATGAKEGAQLLDRLDPRVVFCDVSKPQFYNELENSFQETVGLFSDKLNSNHIHFIADEDLGASPYVVKSPFFGSFLVRPSDQMEEAAQHYGRLIKATLGERAFGVSHFLKPNSKSQTIKLQVTTQKQAAVEAVKNYLLAAKFNIRMAMVIANGVDEILMNAMFDAPTDDLGKPLYTHTARSVSIKLEGRHAVEMEVGYDGNYIAVSAVDHFGSLDKARLLSLISKVYRESSYSAQTQGQGAGLGLTSVFQSGGSLLFVSEARVRTEVILFFKRTENYREFKSQFKFIATQLYV